MWSWDQPSFVHYNDTPKPSLTHALLVPRVILAVAHRRTTRITTVSPADKSCNSYLLDSVLMYGFYHHAYICYCGQRNGPTIFVYLRAQLKFMGTCVNVSQGAIKNNPLAKNITRAPMQTLCVRPRFFTPSNESWPKDPYPL